MARTKTRYRVLVSTLGLALVATSAPEMSSAWEATTTHAGLTEQAALHSHLHQRLRDQLGIERGLFSQLTVPPADAPELFKVLRTLNPTHGYVPDSRGRLLALGWLAAGSVVADGPPKHAANHFYDPERKAGLSDETLRDDPDRLRHGYNTRRAAEQIVRQGMSAIEWLTHEQNPMNLDGFIDQYAKAVSARTPAERSRHIAGSLLAAGALLHVLQDMGSPSHVRNDLAAHLQVVGNDQADVGSRFERLAALAYGRLSVPEGAASVSAPTLSAFFSTEKYEGLADRTAQSWFSRFTLPKTIRLAPGAGSSAIGEQLAKSLARPYPAPLPRLDLDAARSPSGGRLVNDQGVCLANYHLVEDRLMWSMDDQCAAEQIAVILPEVSAYSSGLLDYLYRGVIELRRDGGVWVAATAGAEFGPGEVQIFWDDGRGVRESLSEKKKVEKTAAGEVLATMSKLPRGAQAIAVLFRGTDQLGEPLVAAGYIKTVAPAKAAKKQP